jgi:hypothetical protein
MKGWIRVAPGAIETDRELARLVDRCVAYAKTLPKKPTDIDARRAELRS